MDMNVESSLESEMWDQTTRTPVPEELRWKETTTSLWTCSYQTNSNGTNPKLFFNLYFGCAAFIYSLMTLWLFLACLVGSETFTESGFFYMLAIAGLMWLTTILTLISNHFSSEIGIQKSQLGSTLIFVFAFLLKIVTDSAIFYGSISALFDSNLMHYHEFSQFVSPLLYFGLLYLVIIIGIIVIFTTITIMEDKCGIYATIMKIQVAITSMKSYLKSKFPVVSEV